MGEQILNREISVGEPDFVVNFEGSYFQNSLSPREVFFFVA